MTTGWTTRRGGQDPAVAPGLSPLLLFHKWHRYDREERTRVPTFDTAATRVPFLDDVAAAVREAAGPRYTRWFANYRAALAALGAEELQASTVWRLVAGMGTNPALETGLHLHPLYGVPYLPGSTVKGLVHAVAEAELLPEEPAERPTAAALLADPDRLGELLDQAEPIHRLFGSLTLVPGPPRVGDAGEELPPPATPRSLLEEVARSEAFARLPEPVRDRVHGLLVHSGGRLRFYDALPTPGQSDLVEADLLNPHYPDYYRDEGKAIPPSDDQNPTPVYFLAVQPGVEFLFPFRLEPMQVEGEPKGVEPGDAGVVRQWLISGLTERGAGGKTAAGYGYFDEPGEGDRKRAEDVPGRAARRAPGGRETWTAATLHWDKSRSCLYARSDGREARFDGREVLAWLTEPEVKRLMRDKPVSRDVQVEFQQGGWYKIVAL